MLKLSNMGERLFNSIDNFFQGTVKIDRVENDANLYMSNILKCNHIEWELNQDYFDILISDLRASLSRIIPGFIRRFAIRIQRLVLLYLYTDETEIETIETDNYLSFFLEPGMNIVLSYPQVMQDIIGSKCLFISDWMKDLYRKCNLTFRYGLLKKPYHLLGNFTPNHYEVHVTETCFIMKEFNEAKLNPAFAYHKRN
jgi:hypothetical protein